MWVELQAYDADDTLIYDTGSIADDEVSARPPTELWQLRDQIYDENDQPVHMFWEAARYDHMGTDPLPVGASIARGSHTLSHRYVVGPVPARVEITLRVRPVGLDVLQSLVDSGHLDASVMGAMPTFTAFTAEALWHDDKQRFEVQNTTAFDCDSYLCLYDPNAAGCEG